MNLVRHLLLANMTMALLTYNVIYLPILMEYWPELTHPRNAIGKILSDPSLLIPKIKIH